jgi:NADH:ubiquinone oxidoreductase subunit H
MIRFISTLAETNQAPFNLTEGKSELVSGFNIEFATGQFTLFFIAEYINIIIINALTTIIFLGAFHNPLTPELYKINFTIKTLCLPILFL